MSKKKSTWKHKLAAVLVSFFMIAVILLLGEAFCRLFTRINFLDNSKGLFAQNRFGNTYGNTPNFEGISFGETFYTDADGFRIDPKFAATAAKDAGAILVMGDSVAFGPAVTEDKTIAGYLRRALPQQNIYNGAAIGYDTFDYRNAATAFVKQKPEIKNVFIIFCLNDVNDVSAQQIRSQGGYANNDEAPQSWNPVRIINDFLRSRSKLYLWIKNAMQDTQMAHFRNDLSYYQKDDATINTGLQPLAELKNTLDEAGVKLKVFVMPYEVQFRPNSPAEFLTPQTKVNAFLKQSKIDFYDTTDDFRNAPNPRGLFLFGDPMHFSADGNKLAAQIVCSQVKNEGLSCSNF